MQSFSFRHIQSLKIGIAVLFLIFSLNTFSSAQTLLTDSENLSALTATSSPALVQEYKNISLFNAWDFLRKAKPEFFAVNIALIDSGVDLSDGRHPEFQGVSVTPTVPIAAKDTAGGMGHGTAVAGIIGANNLSADSGNNYIFSQMNGIVSGATNKYALEIVPKSNIAEPKLKITILGFTLWTFAASFDEILRPILPKSIVNMSFGASLCSKIAPELREFKPCISDSDFDDLREYYLEGINKRTDLTFVMSAGNDDINANFHLPGGGINTTNSITVAATKLSDKRTDFSNSGSSVTVSAPGESIYAPTIRGKGNFPNSPGDYSDDFDGTSFSAPMVTGVAAILKSIKPELTPAKIKEILVVSADPIQTGEPNKRLGTGCYADPNDPIHTGCRLNALNAVRTILKPKLSIIASIPIERNPVSIKISPDASRVYAVNSNPGTSPRQGSVSVIDASQNSVLTTIRLPANPTSAEQIAVTPDGRKAYVAVANRVDVLDLAANTFLRSIFFGSLQSDIVSVAVNGQFAYVTDRQLNTVTVINIATDAVVKTIGPTGFREPYGIAVSPDGSRVYVANRANSTLTVIDASTNTVLGTPPIPTSLSTDFSITQLAVSPDGTRVYMTNRGDGRISVIDPIQRREIDLISANGGNLQDVALNQDGTLALVTRAVISRPAPFEAFLAIDVNPNSPTFKAIVDEVQIPQPGFIAFKGSPDAFAYVTGGGLSGQVFAIGEQ